jgi:SAM-dependent methyltransferase
VLDLGDQPISDALLEPNELAAAQPSPPLRVLVCTACWLVQLAAVDGAGHATGEHGHGAAFSTTVMAHAGDWAAALVRRFGLTSTARVLDVSSGDGYLLRPFARRGIRVLGLEPDPGIAAAACSSGVPTRCVRHGHAAAGRLVAEGHRANLVLVNHALAHVDDLGDFIGGLELVLAPGGVIAVEFHHVLQVVQGSQFDIVCHAHHLYLSVIALQAACARHNLTLFDAEPVAVHGGSVRALLSRAPEAPPATPALQALVERERAAGLDRLDGYRGVQRQAASVRDGLVTFLERARASGASTVGYGAPSRGTTLLNYCGITPELVAFTVDRDRRKQGRYLPGCRLPIRAPSAIEVARPDYVLILTWAIRKEIMRQLALVRSWEGRFVVAIPELQVLD